ncbi:SSU ribosomal protein S1P [Clostridium cavendishii DSM 21758]|uniref:SSU ribosomal protein S1P n=1 Tax=Clostridium cavendishii DSM 21758 TaxID=1121302 RepID=A0A1M6UQ49_9CLOT|nr:30S ribosomal protein S1 [Clostridium cavendishii]SHK71337.1 SSU ribosomal protein S1P [Clostridium cavendishii DSM 21758]
MTTEQKEILSMEDAMQEYDLKRINRGDLIKGKVINVTEEEVFINIGSYKDGVITKEELSEDKDVKPSDILKVDDEVFVMVLGVGKGEESILLSKKRADAIKVWEKIKEVSKNNGEINIIIKEVVKGGLVGYFEGVRVFMPASQSAARRIDDLTIFIGKSLEVRIIEFDKNRNKVVVSRRIIEEEIKEKEQTVLWNSLKKGEKRTGTVTKLMKFGAFVNIGGLEGLVHNSDLSWKRITDPSEIVSVGDEVTVYVQEFDRDKNRISLAMKEVNKNPWQLLNGKYKVNDVIKVKIVKFVNFGAFAEVEPGVEGLIHIAEISEDNIAKASDVLEMGQEVKVKVLSIDEEAHKMSLSIKEATESSKEYLKYNDTEEEATIGDLFKNALEGFKFE